MTSSIDYWPLAASLQTSKIPWITKNFTKEIWKVFLQWNKLDTSWSLNRWKISVRNNKLKDIAGLIEKASEWEKMEFILTVKYLKDKIEPENIRSLRLTSLKAIWNPDERLKSIIEELRKSINEDERARLDTFVSKALIQSLKEKRTLDELKNENIRLEEINRDLQTDLEAMSPMNDKIEKLCRSRFAYRNKRRIAYNIHRIVENKKWLSKEEVTRRVLWMADGYALRWTPRRKKGFYGFSHMDINSQYDKVSKKLIERVSHAKDKEKIAIRQIMNDINKAHDDYIHEISDEQKKENLFKINSAIANAA